MTGAALMILAALGFCHTFTVIAGPDLQRNGPLTHESEETETFMPAICRAIPSPRSSSQSVHALTPADIAVLHTVGMPLSERNEASRVVSRLRELLSMFNPNVVTQHEAQTSFNQRTSIQEVDDLSSSNQEVTDWQLVLLFVPADLRCACSPDVDAKVKTTVQEVDTALNRLQNQMHRTLVHVVVWSGHHQKDDCSCAKPGINPGLHKAFLLKALQDSVGDLLKNTSRYSRGEDFTVVLQSSPVVLESYPYSEIVDSHLDELALQLWTDMLQPSTDQTKMKNNLINVPCPTEERPFLRTSINSPIGKEEEVVSKASAPIDPVTGTEVLCKDRNPSPVTPSSVHKVKPGDIKVVAAVGDSLTAANGAGAKEDNLLLVTYQYRGLSWCIGGDGNITTVTTLPNILKEFNPKVTGFSTGIGNQDSSGAFLNQAVAGAQSVDMVPQVRTLVAKMKNDSRIDFNNDWKVITMFIGGNDICAYCTDSVLFSARNVVLRIKEALDILHAEVPRAIVNMVEMFNIIPLRELHQDTSLGCPTWMVNIICPCVLKPLDGSQELQKLSDFNRAYQHHMRELIDSGRYDKHDNFSVILQPFFREVIVPRLEDGRPDRSYFAPDCFHLSQKSHTLMARSLWNNMFEPVGNKTHTQDFQGDINLNCPSESIPFIRTAANSNYTFPGPPAVAPNITNWGKDFSCTPMSPSNSVPTSAHRVRPADIKVVGALGDSLTAAFGARATNLLELPIEYRGVSWSIGGDDTLETVTTLPNILKKFNPGIKGFSTGTGKDNIGFNMAISGAKAGGIPGQVRSLVDAMKNSATVDFQNDWKLVTLFIGGNDLCQYCNDRAALSHTNYGNYLRTSLDILYNEVPRTIVNVVEILEVSDLRKINKDSIGCSLVQKQVCPCFLLPGEDSPELAEMKWINRELQTETINVVYGGRYDGREDFAAVIQPFFRTSVIPLNADGLPDTSFFSEDCFHFSERGQADMAAALWNNMLEPVGKKQTYNNFTNDRNILKCPTEEQPYIFTSINSLPNLEPTSTSVPTMSSSTAEPCTPHCPGTVKGWLAAVLTIIGLLVGCCVTGVLCFCKNKRSKKKRTRAAVDMNSSAPNTYSNSNTREPRRRSEDSEGQNSSF
ncbi:phospholipase B1, membrane-associated isoform X2 [Cyprinodon tularosa]|uniref:phospholipase B1, membrane-associated isoform X2 n=1 Tax=Cyprinodon tularosa TaxID=77115 RepID=UPI0018E22668|nr:phospholipase B1, membrane-associated isoform X2 [Cyprinodon tularosa]